MQPQPVKFIPWATLPSSLAALADGSSLREVAEQASVLSTPLSPDAAREILRNPDRFGLIPALSLLERWIVTDEIVVDLVAVASLYPRRDLIHEALVERHSGSEEIHRIGASDPWHSGMAEILRRKLLEDQISPADAWLVGLRQAAADLSIGFTAIPAETFDRCAALATRTAEALRAAQPDVPWGTYGFGDYKDYGEALQTYYNSVPYLARSYFGVERTLLYYEAAAAARMPVVLHPARFEEARDIELAADDAYAAVKELLSTSLETPVRRQLEALGLRSTVNLPALIIKLIEEAGKRRGSILEVAKELKATAGARSFRDWLRNLEACLCEDTPGGRIEALRILAELKTVASRWSEELDVGLGVRYRKRQLQLSWIPRVGGLLEALETGNFKDPILNRKGYLTFLSSWYER